ncbi:hypothetical protein X777_14601, partial [Ooceraea biroi]
NAEMSDEHEDFALENDEFYLGEKGEEAEAEEDVYRMDEFFIWDDELEAREYEQKPYGERSVGNEERDAPSTATISVAEKSEEEARDTAGPDHALAEIPVEVRINLSFCVILPVELLCLTTFIQEKVTTTDVTEPEQMEQIYRQTLQTYKLRRDDIMERRARTTADVQSYEDKVRKTRDENARVFNELLDREREVATGLIYTKTGGKITERAINEITRRQVLRHEIVIRNRYKCLILQYRLEDLNSQLRDLEALGEGMTTMDYEALHVAQINCRDKLDERDRELEKLRSKIAQVVNGIAHYKEKETCLAEDIEFEEHELNEHCEQAIRVREDVNKLHLILRDLRRAHDAKRHDAGLLMAQPVLREMEKTMKLLDVLRNDIEIIKQEIQQDGPANRRKTTSAEASAMTTMTQD